MASNRPNAWTQKEIEILKSGFLAGKLVKTLADEVGRSASAVNKFLSRSGIRSRRWTIDNSKHRDFARNNLFNAKQSKPSRMQRREEIASFIDVVNYLKEKGYTISKINSQNNFFYQEKYLVNNKPTSEVKMLILANRLRTEERKNIFLVPGLECE